MSKDSVIYYLREKTGLWNQLLEHVRDVLLPLRRERLLIARPSPKGDNDHLSLLRRSCI
jgi:hypothetical protein